MPNKHVGEVGPIKVASIGYPEPIPAEVLLDMSAGTPYVLTKEDADTLAWHLKQAKSAGDWHDAVCLRLTPVT